MMPSAVLTQVLLNEVLSRYKGIARSNTSNISNFEVPDMIGSKAQSRNLFPF